MTPPEELSSALGYISENWLWMVFRMLLHDRGHECYTKLIGEQTLRSMSSLFVGMSNPDST